MGIKVEFNPDLCLREFGTEGRDLAECVPPVMTTGTFFQFLKEGQRCFWFEGPVDLRITKGNGNFGDPIAQVRIINASHHIRDGKVWTEGLARIL
jgi:hypothetical protein